MRWRWDHSRSRKDFSGSGSPLECVEQPSSRWICPRRLGCRAVALPRPISTDCHAIVDGVSGDEEGQQPGLPTA
eukprot:scaffold56739_cov66-Phaeocystis_antarctica.AAC.2